MIEKLFNNLQPLILYVTHNPVNVFGLCVILAVAGFLGAVNLKIDNDLSKLIPEGYPSVQALNRLREQVVGEAQVRE